MSAETDDAKGRIKEAAGALTNDDDLRTEGKADQAGSRIKGIAEDFKDKLDDAVDAIKDKFAKKTD